MSRKKMLDEEKKSHFTININEELMNRIDIVLKKDNDKRSRLIERLLIDYIEKNEYKLKL